MAKKFDLKEFAEWAAKQDPDEDINFCDSSACAFFRFTGRDASADEIDEAYDGLSDALAGAANYGELTDDLHNLLSRGR